MRIRTLSLFLIIALLFAHTTMARPSAVDTSADDASSEVASAWLDLLYNIVKVERTAPPPASRIYGITAVALYESIVPGTGNNRTLVGQLNGLVALPQPNKKTMHWPSAANTTISNTIRGLFPNISTAS